MALGMWEPARKGVAESGGDMLHAFMGVEEEKSRTPEKAAANQAATMQTPTQDSQPEAQTGPMTGGGGSDDGGGSVLGLDQNTAIMVGGGALALVAVLVMASR